jgi:hypothetical protein
MKIDNDTELEEDRPVFDSGVSSREHPESVQLHRRGWRARRRELQRNGFLATEWE